MKKRIATALTMFLSLTLVACGGKKCEKHQWDKWTVKTPKTCTTAGEEEHKCKVCGAKETRPIDAGHTYNDDWTEKTPATCQQEGVEHRFCVDCNHEDTRQTAKIDHVWEEKDTVNPVGDDDVGYINIECNMCHKKGIRIAAAQAEITYTNTSKTTLKTAPEGCVKLPSDGDSFLLKFNVAEAKTGVIYQRGSMDYWYTSSNENQKKTYYSQRNGHTDEANKVGNFKVEVGADLANLANVVLPDETTKTYGDMLPADVGFSGVDGTDWSQIGDCLVGNVSLSAGMNYVKFTRVDSYNLAVHDFDIIFN